MSKYAIRGGHSLDIRGACGIVDEVTEDRKITAKVIEYLRQLGHEVLDVTPTNSGSSLQDLSVPVNKANDWGADYFASIHLNASNGLGHGTEVLYISTKGKEYADRIVSKLANLGFTNRGSKQDVRGLYEFNHTVMPNNILEIFFCDNQYDVDLYNKLGIDTIARVIVEGITGQSIQSSVPIQQPTPIIVPTPVSQPAPVEQPKPQVDQTVLKIQQILNRLKVKDDNGNVLIEDGISGSKTVQTIKRFQSICGISQDSIWGNQSQNCADQIFCKPLCGIQYVQRVPSRYIQWRLGIQIDGIFGNGTASAVKQWQSRNGLVADGVVGKFSWSLLIG